MASVVGILLVLVFVLLLARGLVRLSEGKRDSSRLVQAAGWILIVTGGLGVLFGAITWIGHFGDDSRGGYGRHRAAVHGHMAGGHMAGDHRAGDHMGDRSRMMKGGDLQVDHQGEMMPGGMGAEPESEAMPEDGGE